MRKLFLALLISGILVGCSPMTGVTSTPLPVSASPSPQSGDVFRLASDDLSQVTDGPPPPPVGGPIVPNASLITGRVLGSSIVEQTDASGTGLTLYVLEIEVLSSEVVDEGTLNLVGVAQVIEVYSKKNLNFVQVGDMVEAEVRLAGDEWGQTFWFRDIGVISAEP